MIQIILPDATKVRHLSVYLALEEWVARRLPAGDYFFSWIVWPTVIIGRNQDIDKEVNLQYCRENGIDVVRRRSGGGCVFADLSNIMLSHITASTDVRTTFAEFTGLVAAQLRAMGIDAEASGRNDIMVGGRKISGNAFYHLPGRSIVHGTMLYDTTFAHMMQAITPERAKLESKRVTSVSSHIVTAHELLPAMSFAEFHRRLVQGLYTGEYRLDESEYAEVTAIAAAYTEPSWLYGRGQGRNTRGISATRRIEGVGTLNFTARLDGENRLCNPQLTGDFFMMTDLDEGIFNRLKGVTFSREALAEALAGTDTLKIIANLQLADLLQLIASAKADGGDTIQNNNPNTLIPQATYTDNGTGNKKDSPA